MLICARCTGFYLGLLLGIPFGFTLSFFPHLSLLPMIVVLALALAPFLLDGLSQHLGWRESNNGLRLATGLLAGGVISAVLVELALYGAASQGHWAIE